MQESSVKSAMNYFAKKMANMAVREGWIDSIHIEEYKELVCAKLFKSKLVPTLLKKLKDFAKEVKK